MIYAWWRNTSKAKPHECLVKDAYDVRRVLPERFLPDGKHDKPKEPTP